MNSLELTKIRKSKNAGRDGRWGLVEKNDSSAAWVVGPIRLAKRFWARLAGWDEADVDVIIFLTTGGGIDRAA